MKNSRLELETKDKKYVQYKNNKRFHLEIKNELNSTEKSIIEKGKIKFKNIEKYKLKKIKEIKIKNEIKYKLKIINENKEKLNIKERRKYLLKIENKYIEQSSLEVKFQIEKKKNQAYKKI